MKLLSLTIGATTVALTSAQTAVLNPEGGITRCLKINKFEQFASAIANTPTNGVINFCPFSIDHDGNAEDGIDITTPNLQIMCDKKSGNSGTYVTQEKASSFARELYEGKGVIANEDPPKCTISGSARHINIKTSGTMLIGFDFYHSEYGAVYVASDAGNTNLLHLAFFNNVRVAPGSGSAIEIAEGATYTAVLHCDFSENEAPDGGAISSSSSLTVYRSFFYENHANEGNGAAISSNTDLILSRSEFLSNTVENGDGPAINDPTTKTCDGGENKACLNLDIDTNLYCDGIYVVSTCDAFGSSCFEPSSTPTVIPTADPTPAPSIKPSGGPTPSPTSSPSGKPSATPTAKPSTSPTVSPTSKPSAKPSISPTPVPTAKPSASPTISMKPSMSPSYSPTERPSPHPSSAPSCAPSFSPTNIPSSSPSVSMQPSTGVSIKVPTVREPTLGSQSGKAGTRAPSHASHAHSHTHNSHNGGKGGSQHNHTHTSHDSHRHHHMSHTHPLHAGSDHKSKTHTHTSAGQGGGDSSSGGAAHVVGHVGSNHTHLNHSHTSKYLEQGKGTSSVGKGSSADNNVSAAGGGGNGDQMVPPNLSNDRRRQQSQQGKASEHTHEKHEGSNHMHTSHTHRSKYTSISVDPNFEDKCDPKPPLPGGTQRRASVVFLDDSEFDQPRLRRRGLHW